ncbi:hypothetical protein SAMN02745673_01926 [Marinactinospora thermotolerans DSM 45154]|uniref:Uncharacterized protein n=1 Tax=Marinactinospora thermotolerans DSM 45154 TaxID=1122192 RepID=A0A1T4PP11_9ACTN|nr:hypothetical protein SAMN02745673_01926 [Marinactinospora thermotolerans DSM 45154]
MRSRLHPAIARVNVALLLMAVLGLGLMHTLGHLGEGGHHGSAGSATISHAAPQDTEPASLGPQLPDLDPSSTCLTDRGPSTTSPGPALAALTPAPDGHLPPPARLLCLRDAEDLTPASPPSLAQLQVLRI